MIREANQDDVIVLTGLVNGFFANGELDGTGLEPDSDTIEFFIRDLLDDGGKVFVAEIEGQIVGAIAGRIAPWMFNYNISILVELGWFIPKESRERYPMAAMSLRKTFHKWGKARGATVLIMSSTTREESPRVRQFYEKSGLKHVDSNYIGRL
jgi:hypothetical protein